MAERKAQKNIQKSHLTDDYAGMTAPQHEPRER